MMDSLTKRRLITAAIGASIIVFGSREAGNRLWNRVDTASTSTAVAASAPSDVMLTRIEPTSTLNPTQIAIATQLNIRVVTLTPTP